MRLAVDTDFNRAYAALSFRLNAARLVIFEIKERLVGNASKEESDYDLLTVVMIPLGAPDAAESKSLLCFLDVLLSKELQAAEKKTILRDDFEVSMTSKVGKEIKNMCSLAEGTRQRTEAKGKEEGQKIGEKQGVERASLKHALKLMKSLKTTADDTLNLLGVPSQSKKSLLKMIDERLATE